MALEREDVPFHASHATVEGSSRNHDGTQDFASSNHSSSKDSVMNDGTTSAPEIEAHMTLEHDISSSKDSLAPPSSVVPLGVAQGNELDGLTLPEASFDDGSSHELTNAPSEPQQATNSFTAASMLTPTPVFTLRRSPRASTPVSKSRENSVMRDSTPKREHPRFSERIPATNFREGFSSPMPSPSIFQATDSVKSSGIDMFTTAVNRASNGSADQRTNAFSPSEMDVNMEKADESESMQHPDPASASFGFSSVHKPFFTPSSHSRAPEGLQFPSSSADLSAIFASPIPQLSQPVMSPFRLNQSFQSFSVPQPLAQTSSTPPPMTPSAVEAEDSPTFPMQDSSLPVSPQREKATPQMNSVQPESEEKYEDSAMQEIEGTINNAQTSSPTMTVEGPTTPQRSLQMIHSAGNPISTTPSMLLGSLTPVIGPRATAQLPFPITPQHLSRADLFTPVRDRSNVFAPVGNNPVPTTPLPIHANSHHDAINTPSRIPVSVSTPGQPSSLLDDHPSGPTGTSANLQPNSTTSLLSPPTTSQLRQPSNLRSTINGAASKIPRPGKKPYAKPISRLPKPKASGRVSPVSSVASSKPSTISMPMSPIKTRRGRANQATGIPSTQSLSSNGELPPGAIIYEPPAPRIRPKVDFQEVIPINNEETPVKNMNDEIASARASPPVETGLSPPKSGVFLKSESRRLKAEAAATTSTSSVIPHFTATAPSLGIFPSLPRPKGKGKNTIMRPMMMPLDPTSLRNLTTSNTLRNQHYVCSKVETKVVLKEGKRPASPTTKVKTILEKKKEGQEKSRGERAARRVEKLAATNDQDQEMVDSTDPAMRKHPRGAGDEEDYETPVKPVRDMDIDEDQEESRKRKRVKWDKDLLQRFELDETNMEGIRKAAELAKARMVTKSCIPTQVLLDPLGNVPQADVPIPNLPREQIVVTKLVYIEELPPSERPKRASATKANARIGMS